MNIELIRNINTLIAVVQSEELVIIDAQSALDFMMTINYETDSRSIILNKEAITEEFFQLSSKLAGEVLQKFINYHMKLAVIGNFAGYTSKSLKDFIYESNKGKDIFFVSTLEEAVNKLSLAK